MIFDVKRILKLLDHFRANLVAVLTDTRSHTSHHIFRFSSEFLCHCLQSRLSHAVYRSSPAGMGKSDGFIFCIYKIKRYAVREKCYQSHPWNIGYKTIYIAIITVANHSLSKICFRYHAHIGRMGLPCEHHPVHVDT